MYWSPRVHLTRYRFYSPVSEPAGLCGRPVTAEREHHQEYISKVMDKLGMWNRMELAVWASTYADAIRESPTESRQAKGHLERVRSVTFRTNQKGTEKRISATVDRTTTPKGMSGVVMASALDGSAFVLFCQTSRKDLGAGRFLGL